MTFAKYMKICKSFGIEQISDSCFGFRQFAFITWFCSKPAAVCEKDLKKFLIKDEKFVYQSSSDDDFGAKYDKFNGSDKFKKYLTDFVVWYKDLNQKYKLQKIQKDFK